MSKITGFIFARDQGDSFYLPFAEDPDVFMPSVREGSFEVGPQIRLEGDYFLGVHLSKAADSKLLFVFSLIPDVETKVTGDKIPLHTPVTPEDLMKSFAAERRRNYGESMPEQYDMAAVSPDQQMRDHISNDLKACLLGVLDASDTPDSGNGFWACLAENFENEFIGELGEALKHCVFADENNGGGTPPAARYN